jgi:hypothetical protein
MFEIKNEKQKDLERQYYYLHDKIVEANSLFANMLLLIADMKANPEYTTYLAKDYRDKVDDFETSAKSLVILDYDYLKEITKTAKDKEKTK